KILGVTTDNATSNNTTIDVLVQKLPGFGGKFSWTRCFDHIVNLCAKSVLRPFN
ncbi:hypothetical protein L226DRAFT_426232, partial [Lentinus tigrinus ALCF2SS1-7]